MAIKDLMALRVANGLADEIADLEVSLEELRRFDSINHLKIEVVGSHLASRSREATIKIADESTIHAIVGTLVLALKEKREAYAKALRDMGIECK